VTALVAVAGGIAAYDNSTEVRRFFKDFGSGKPEQVAAKASSGRPLPPKPVPARPSPSSTAAASPVPPAPIPAAAVPSASAPSGPIRQVAALVPPQPIAKPGAIGAKDAMPKEAVARPGSGLSGAYQAKFYLCGTAKQDDCVVAADRFVFHGEKIRLVGIEVPDIKKPRCEEERIKASDAELRVRAFLDSGPFELVTWQGNDQEVDGHKLRQVTRNGISLSDILVREGLARRPGAKGGWC
jgi:endonuclease YncB( thermonuclease family)